MKATLQKWGNSVALRLPRSILEPAHLKAGQKVEVSAEADRVVIQAAQSEYTLESLLEKITKKNLHDPADTGMPVGKELL
jgi:antitoxin MazE